MDDASAEKERRHRIEMIDTEVNVLRQLWQDPSATSGERHVILQRTTELLVEQREQEER